MSQTSEGIQTPAPGGHPAPAALPAHATHPTDRPLDLWPEGVLAAAAGITLAVIALLHRVWLQRKAGEIHRAVEEFQRQGGVEDLTHVARQAADFLKGSGR